MKFGTDWPSGLKIMGTNMYIAPGQPPGVNYFSLTVLCSQYSPLLQVFFH